MNNKSVTTAVSTIRITTFTSHALAGNHESEHQPQRPQSGEKQRRQPDRQVHKNSFLIRRQEWGRSSFPRLSCRLRKFWVSPFLPPSRHCKEATTMPKLP